MILLSSFAGAYAQQPQLATYRETAQVLVDEKIQNQTTAFITLSTTSPLEMRVPTTLDEKITNATNVTSVAITNANSCSEGVNDQLCIIFTIYNPSLIESYNITKIQTVSHAIGDTLINDTNKAFLLNASFWSVYVQPKGAFSNTLGTSGALVGNRTISVIYTAPQLKSSYLFDQLTSILLPSQIRNAGGFYDVAKKLADSTNSTVSFAITPTANNQSLYQLQVSTHSPIKGKIDAIRPLDFFGVDHLDRSTYFSGGFFPLNSLFQISILSNNSTYITSHGGNIVPTNSNDIPTDLTKDGWVFSPSTGSGQEISGIYIFGKTTTATSDDLTLAVDSTPPSLPISGVNSSGNGTLPVPNNSDYSIYAIAGIVIAGGGAIYLFMRKR
jgi:hypothetical protein